MISRILVFSLTSHVRDGDSGQKFRDRRGGGRGQQLLRHTTTTATITTPTSPSSLSSTTPCHCFTFRQFSTRTHYLQCFSLVDLSHSRASPHKRSSGTPSSQPSQNDPVIIQFNLERFLVWIKWNSKTATTLRTGYTNTTNRHQLVSFFFFPLTS